MVATALAASIPAQIGAPATAPPDTTRTRLATELDRAVQVRAGESFAGAVLVARDGVIILRKGYGVAGLAGQPAEPTTLFDVASVSKSFTAAAILVLEARGKLGVHDPIGRHFTGVPPDKASIRIHDLLTHTSGLADQVDFTDEELADRDAWLARMLREPLLFPPGERFAYNNAGYSMLAALIEVVARRPFETWVKKNVLRRAGMRSSGFLSDPELDSERAAARRQPSDHSDFPDTAVDWPWHWAFRGATGIVTNVDDLYHWDRTLYGDRVLKARQRAAMFKPFAGNYAYGWVSTRTERRTTKLHHDGRTYGFRAVLARFPDEDAAVIVAGNRDGQVRELALDLERLLFAAPPPAHRLTPAIGTYRLPRGDEFQVAADGDTLVLRALGPEASTRLQRGSASPGDDPFCRRSLAERADKRLRPLTRGRARKLQESFAGSDAAAAADRARVAWQRAQDQHGTFRGARAIGSRRADRATYFHVSFGKTQTTWRAVWNDERQAFTSLQPVELPFPFEAKLSWRHGHEFHLRSADGFTDITVEFEIGPGSRAHRLRWRDRSNPSGAELVCRRR